MVKVGAKIKDDKYLKMEGVFVYLDLVHTLNYESYFC
jgi:hypothetical protein